MVSTEAFGPSFLFLMTYNYNPRSERRETHCFSVHIRLNQWHSGAKP